MLTNNSEHNFVGEKESAMNIRLFTVLLSVFAVGCTTVTSTIDTKTGIEVTTVAVRGCGNPSQTMTWVNRPGKPEDSFASAGADPCNTILASGAQVAAAAVLPGGGGIINNVGSQAISNQTQNAALKVTN